jgi:hypothetical protein
MDVKQNHEHINHISFKENVSFSEKDNKELQGEGLAQEEYRTGLKHFYGLHAEQNYAVAHK